MLVFFKLNANSIKQTGTVEDFRALVTLAFRGSRNNLRE